MSLSLPPPLEPIVDKNGRATTALQGLLQQLVNALVLSGPITAGNLVIGGTGTNQGTDGGAVPVGGITALTGDVAAGPGNGSQVATLAVTTVIAGTYVCASVAVDAAGRLTAASSGPGANFVQWTEMTAPAAGATNTVRLYAEDNGGGKTRLMALFPTGAAQQVAIEP